ncbi:hypothetical protein [Undibacterium oligocarboniphilum]|uniref:Uncharacterized protein n=1 Tax=Undibacterium oligocarboniphilum TaxID=666702 RepID=A0A850QG98_9BURK|nr:hypothetical protein [Undibacterium oligocarboniphilum]MBC3870952.1 hypothetical protein [Undibacterium oligocarboniphilum]NVO76425.1 hypothetical protein [Undibacterium oligocarboniphilum]
MANKALATRQRMQFRTEPSQIPANRNQGNKRITVPPLFRSATVRTATASVQAEPPVAETETGQSFPSATSSLRSKKHHV